MYHIETWLAIGQLGHIFIFVTKAMGKQKLKPKMLHLWMLQEAFNLIDFSKTFSEVVLDLLY